MAHRIAKATDHSQRYLTSSYLKIGHGKRSLLYDLVGLELKLAKWALKTPQRRDAVRAIFVALGDQIQRIGGSFQGPLRQL